MKKYFFIAGLGITFGAIESIFYEDYCDVNSYHYMDDINRKTLLIGIKLVLLNSRFLFQFFKYKYYIHFYSN